MEQVTFGEFMRTRREQLGYSLVEASQKIGCSDAAVTSWETNASRPNSYNIFKISKAYEVSSEDLKHYEFIHKKTGKSLGKPIAEILKSIDKSFELIELVMSSESVFEHNLKSKAFEIFQSCKKQLEEMKYLDDGF
jgi:transcriptional regulator with XRE-family HTH domain